MKVFKVKLAIGTNPKNVYFDTIETAVQFTLLLQRINGFGVDISFLPIEEKDVDDDIAKELNIYTIKTMNNMLLEMILNLGK